MQKWDEINNSTNSSSKRLSNCDSHSTKNSLVRTRTLTHTLVRHHLCDEHSVLLKPFSTNQESPGSGTGAWLIRTNKTKDPLSSHLNWSRQWMMRNHSVNHVNHHSWRLRLSRTVKLNALNRHHQRFIVKVRTSLLRPGPRIGPHKNRHSRACN